MKSCYVIVAHAPTPAKEKVLRSLLSSLKRSNSDIMLVSHLIPPSDILDEVDHFIYDKNNQMYQCYPTHQQSFAPKCVTKLMTTVGINVTGPYESSSAYHGIAATSLMFQGLLNAKTFGYDICHLIEYDTEVETLDEFRENEELLFNSNHASVFYHCGPHPHMTYCQISSYNLNLYSLEDFNWNRVGELLKEIAMRLDYDLNNGMIEIGFFETLHLNRNSIQKTMENITSNKITIDLSNRLELDVKDLVSMMPYMENDTDVNIFCLYRRKIKEGERDLKFVINQTEIIRTLSFQNEWFMFHAEKLDNLNRIDFYVDDELIKTYDFVNEIIKEHFRVYSHRF